jgi:hypothetical protein
MSDDAATKETWALVEIFGHRRHYGRVTEVERFGSKMLRVDVPLPKEGDQAEEVFETFHYGGAAIFGMTEMSEEACRKWASHDRPRPAGLITRMPPPDLDDDEPEEYPE